MIKPPTLTISSTHLVIGLSIAGNLLIGADVSLGAMLVSVPQAGGCLLTAWPDEGSISLSVDHRSSLVYGVELKQKHTVESAIA